MNVQGDEPLLEPALITRMADVARGRARCGDRHRVPSDRRCRRGVQSRTSSRSCSTRAATRCTSAAPRFPGRATRSRGDARTRCRRACRSTATTACMPTASRSCARYPTLAPAPIERFEALEQLRALWHGYRIVVEITTARRRRASTRRRTSQRVRALVRRRRRLTADRCKRSDRDAPLRRAQQEALRHATDPARAARRRQGDAGRPSSRRRSAFRRSPPATCCARP